MLMPKINNLRRCIITVVNLIGVSIRISVLMSPGSNPRGVTVNVYKVSSYLLSFFFSQTQESEQFSLFILYFLRGASHVNL